MGIDPTDNAGPFCAVWVYSARPEAFERAARFALLNTGYDNEVVLVFTEEGTRLMQTDRTLQLVENPQFSELIEALVARGVTFELDAGSARRAGFVETLSSLIPTLRVADAGRIADLTTGARVCARYG